MSGSDDLSVALELRLLAERYAIAVDTGDSAMFAGLFTPDGVLEAPRGTYSGREELAGVPSMMQGLYARTHHGVVAMAPAIEGDKASARTHAYARHYYRAPDRREYCYEMTIVYEDEFRRTGEGWRLARRKLVMVGDATFSTGPLHKVTPSGVVDWRQV